MTSRLGGIYFGVNDKGNIVVHPKADGPTADLKELVDEVRVEASGCRCCALQQHPETPVVELNESSGRDRRVRLQGQYRGVYPIKVNQVANVVEEILKAVASTTTARGGSKPELLA